MTRTIPVFLLFIMALNPAARADAPRTPEVLAAESDRALALAQDGKLDEAVAVWLDVLDEVSPKGRGDVHVNLAVAYKALGRLSEAWYHLDAVLKLSKTEDPAVVSERAAIEKELARSHVPLRFSCNAQGTLLFLTLERNLPYPCPLRWWFPRGTEGHVFAVAPDHEPGETAIRAHELDRDRRVVVHLEVMEKPVVVDESDVPVVKKPREASGQVWKWSLFGGGMGMVAAGAILQVMAYNKDQDLRKKWDPTGAADRGEFDEIAASYSSAFNSDVKPLAYTAYALYGVGGAAAAAGLTFLVADWSSPHVDSSVHIAPLAAPGVGGFVLDLSF